VDSDHVTDDDHTFQGEYQNFQDDDPAFQDDAAFEGDDPRRAE
jgi:hypothetical protein